VSKPTELEFRARFDPHYAVQRVSREVYRERYPPGMHTNGPSTVTLPTEIVQYLLTRWEKPAAIRAAGGE
jgi:hypothetical protein